MRTEAWKVSDLRLGPWGLLLIPAREGVRLRGAWPAAPTQQPAPGRTGSVSADPGRKGAVCAGWGAGVRGILLSAPSTECDSGALAAGIAPGPAEGYSLRWVLKGVWCAEVPEGLDGPEVTPLWGR